MKNNCRSGIRNNENIIRTHVHFLMYADDAAFVSPDPTTIKNVNVVLTERFRI